ncbi:unnamed protein product [[Candida] boidinii]|uniref:Unnamed protein product n=1 Tax=Candida boidinii TaxID=5477 RepID=A0ACB5U6N1_CANBO|nr:unnamed protein product [[Candida] boidinii]
MNSIDDQLFYNDNSNNNTNNSNKINSGINTYQSPSLNSMQTSGFTPTTGTNISNMSNLNTYNNSSSMNNLNNNTNSLFHSSNSNSSSDLNLNLDQSTINYQTTSLNNYKLSDILKLIPSLINHPDFKISKLERLLSIYWNFFHVRFPILHKPTFIAKNSPTLLLLAMIMLGAKLSNCVPDLSSSIEEKLINPKTLADQIANPLRWLLFSSPHFQPPAKSWIIQSLLMLEFYEKNCSSRSLHERAHLHHGTTIQLLRRSPTLGGSPLKSSTADDANTSSNRGNNNTTRSSGERLLQQWIEAESMKRATFMCFYMDAIDSISFGHQILIYAHQLQLTMPCEDELWENYSLIKNGGGSIYYSKPPPFLLALKNILNGIPTKVNSLGKKVLVAGICAIMYQIQQRDLQIAYGLDKFGINESVDSC